MKLNILNEKLEKVDEIHFLKDFDKKELKIYNNIINIAEKDKQLSNSIDYNIEILSPTDTLEDFYINFLNKKLLEYTPYKLNEIKGALISNFLDFNKNKTLLNILKEVYSTNQPKIIYLEQYEKNILIKKIKINITKIDNFIYILAKNETDYDLSSIKEDGLLNNYPEPIIIVQNDYIVQCNKKYLKLQDQNYDEVLNKKIEDITTDTTLIDLINKNINKILERKKYSYAFPFEIKEKNEIGYYNLNLNYIFYKNKPAILIIFNDIGKEQLKKQKELQKALEKSKKLDLNLEKVQNLTKISLYDYDFKTKKYTWYNKGYILPGLDPVEYTDDMVNYIVEEDRDIWRKKHAMCTPEHPEESFVTKVSANKIHYIKTFVKYDFDEKGNKLSYTSLLQDITDLATKSEELQKALNETIELNDNLNRIQTASKTFIAYTYDLKNFSWTPEVYNILEIKPEKYKNKKYDIINRFVLDEDKKIVDNNFSFITPSNPKVTFTVRFKTGKGNIKYIRTIIHHFYDKNNKFIKGISFNQDVTKEMIQEKELKNALDISKKFNFSFEKVQKVSKISMYYYDHETKEYTWYNQGYNVLGLEKSEYVGSMEKYLIDEDKYLWVEKHAMCTPEHPEVSFVQRAYSAGRLIYIKTFISYEFDENGNKKAHISLFQDITDIAHESNELKEALTEALELRDNLNRIQKNSKTAIGYSKNLIDVVWTPEMFNILEINPKDYTGNVTNLTESFMTEEDIKYRKECKAKLSPMNPDITFIQRLNTEKGNIKYLKTVIHRDYDKNGEILKSVAFIQDITTETTYQKQLEKALENNKFLLKEVHHRVKNNLQIILSLINLNLDFNVSTDNILINTQNQLYAMALIHEKIYGSDSLSEVDMKSYIESLVSSVLDLYESDIKTHITIDQINLHMEQSIPLGLIINELITNTIKYAFPNKDGNIYIDFKKEKTHYKFIYKDDGIGLPENIDLENLSSLGLIVVNNLSIQLGGTFSILECEGTGFKIEFEKN